VYNTLPLDVKLIMHGFYGGYPFDVILNIFHIITGYLSNKSASYKLVKLRILWLCYSLLSNIAGRNKANSSCLLVCAEKYYQQLLFNWLLI